MGTPRSLGDLKHASAIRLTSIILLLACSAPYLAQGGPGDDRAIAKAVFAYEVANQRRAEGGTVDPVDMELDIRRLQWEHGSDSLARLGTASLLREWIRFKGHHRGAVINEILRHTGAARACESANTDEPCRSKVEGAVIVAMSAPRLASPDSAQVRVVMSSEVQDWRFMKWLALYLVTLRRSAEGWEVVSEERVFET